MEGAVSYITDNGSTEEHSPCVDLDSCGCLTSEEHLSRCVLWTAPGVVLARPMRTTSERARASNRARMARWKAAHPERWREIQRRSYERRMGRAA